MVLLYQEVEIYLLKYGKIKNYKTLSHNRELLYSQLSEAKIANEELNRKYETLKSKLEHNRNLEYLDRIFHGTGA